MYFLHVISPAWLFNDATSPLVMLYFSTSFVSYTLNPSFLRLTVASLPLLVMTIIFDIMSGGNSATCILREYVMGAYLFYFCTVFIIKISLN